MSHFAEINSDNIVTNVIVAEQDFIDSGVVGDASNWIQTSYNTRGGVHYAPNSNTPQPYPSWVLDDDTCIWNAPTAYPDDGKWYSWDEDNTEWVEIE